MKTWTYTTIALLSASTAFAGGVERSDRSITAIYDTGSFASFGFSHVSPEATGVLAHPLAGDLDTSNGLESYNNFSATYKNDLGSNISYAIIYDRPYGASVNYAADESTAQFMAAGAGAPSGESIANFESSAITAVGRYKLSDNISFIGGLSYQQLQADISRLGGVLTLESEKTSGMGWLVGAAYEIPEIALRLDVTYRSAIEHKDIALVESNLTLPVVNADSTTDVTTPESLDINFQTGVNANTLVMAGARWVNWSEFELSAPYNGSIVDYDDDVVTYNIGVGRKINDQLSVLASVTWEGASDKPVSLLAPTDGSTALGLGARYKISNSLEVAGGFSYVMLGDATDDLIGASWSDNSATAFGISLKQSF